MGGSGGGGFFYESKPEEIAQKIRNEEEKSQNSVYETSITALMRDLLSVVNDRDTDSIQRHLTTIEGAVHKDIEGYIDLRYAGSVAKHTYVDGLSDIDSIAILNDCDLVNATPNEVKKHFYDKLCERLPSTDIRIGNLAVTIKFSSGIEIQILPAMKDETGIRIPSSRRSNEWSHIIKPDKFALALRYTNTHTSGKLVPVIKLAKSIIASFPESRKISGYHVESLAIEVFGQYTGEKKLKPMLKHFFSEAAKYVLAPIKDKTGQSVHVDDYLGETNSLIRKMVADSMSTVARKMQNADGSREIRIWEQFLK